MLNASTQFCTAPVVLLAFNRPAHTRQVLDRIRQARPPIVLVVADGPRQHVPADASACAEVRALIETGLDWEAKVLTNYAPANLGLRQRVSSGLTWAFEQVERAIILEDDCVPEPSFFRFCSELLDYYARDSRVGVITGNNFQPPGFHCAASYYFSRFNHCWGWATWRRAWQLFAGEMTGWPQLRKSGWLESLFPEPGQARYWSEAFEAVYNRRIDSWAYCWTFSCWSQSLLTAIPKVNLVSNIGFWARLYPHDQRSEVRDQRSEVRGQRFGREGRSTNGCTIGTHWRACCRRPAFVTSGCVPPASHASRISMFTSWM